MMIRYVSSLVVLVMIWSCSGRDSLPYLGMKKVDEKGDTLYHSIRDFRFVNQDNDTLTQDDFKDKVYVADFFFTSCPTICPVMKSQMLRVYEKFGTNPGVAILSHTIDPRHDSVEVLHAYRQRLGIEGKGWQFVTGPQEDVYEIAQKYYMVSATEDSTAKDDGGFIHSGAFILVDRDRHVRGLYDGTKEKEVNKLMKDIEKLLASYQK